MPRAVLSTPNGLTYILRCLRLSILDAIDPLIQY